MDNLIEINRYEFSNISAACERHKKFENVNVVSAKTTAYDNAIGMMDIIKAVVWEKTSSLEDIFDLASQVTGYEAPWGNEDESFDAENEALKNRTQKKAMQYKRYCRAELAQCRANHASKFAPMIINIGDVYGVQYYPQALFIEKSKLTGDTIITAVHYKDKKAPSGMTDTSNIVDEVAEYDEKLSKAGEPFDHLSKERLINVPKWTDPYLGLKYIENLMESESFLNYIGAKRGDVITAVGAIYFMEMKSNDDKCADYFDGNSNIITLEESYKVGEDNLSHKTDLDNLFKDYAEMHVLGIAQEKCNAKDCEYCTCKASCHFQKTPAKQEKVAISSNASKEFKPTAPQQELINLREGNHLVIARAGSGKTATMVQLIKALIDDGAKMNEIFMTTFTNAGVREFKERLAKALSDKPDVDVNDAKITTFHGFALEICKDNYAELGFTKEPREVNEVDKARTVDELVSGKKFTGPDALYKKGMDGVVKLVRVAIELFDIIGENDGILNEPDAAYKYMHMLSPTSKEAVTETTVSELIDVYGDYKKELMEENVILFSDMEPMMHQILDAHPGYLDKYGFKYVILDEFQDSNEIQMRTVRALAQCPAVRNTQ